MLDRAKHIVEQKSGQFEPDKFEDHHYERALTELLEKPADRCRQEGAPNNVANLMDALLAKASGCGGNTTNGGAR
jgi:DNA end-binding protein Ku